jgi:TolA-binding protein
MTGSRSILKCLIYILICAGTFFGGGCRFPWPPISGDSAAPPSPLLVKQYRQAVTAYQANEYDLAARRFEDIQNRTRDRNMARKAMFGLACARLMSAETPQQYHEAVALLESWMQEAPTDFEKENPVLMVPLIREKMLFSNIPLTADGGGDIEASPKVSQWLVINAAKEIKLLRKKIESADQSKRKLKDRIGLLEKEISKLQKKIKALETIDQKIQKKKNAIPSADSTPSW